MSLAGKEVWKLWQSGSQGPQLMTPRVPGRHLPSFPAQLLLSFHPNRQIKGCQWLRVVPSPASTGFFGRPSRANLLSGIHTQYSGRKDQPIHIHMASSLLIIVDDDEVTNSTKFLRNMFLDPVQKTSLPQKICRCNAVTTRLSTQYTVIPVYLCVLCCSGLFCLLCSGSATSVLLSLLSPYLFVSFLPSSRITYSSHLSITDVSIQRFARCTG